MRTMRGRLIVLSLDACGVYEPILDCIKERYFCAMNFNLAAVFFALVIGALAGAKRHQHRVPSPLDNIFLSQNYSGVVRARNGTGAANMLYHEEFGYFDYPHREWFHDGAKFPIGSNTKVYIAIALYQQQERGLVNLSRPVNDYLNATDFKAFGLPQYAEKYGGKYCPRLVNSTVCEQITFKQLLGMTSGIDQDPVMVFVFDIYPGSTALVAGQYLTQPLLYKPGTQYYYSNPSFMLAAYFVEKFGGMAWPEWVRKHIWKPLNVNVTYDMQNNNFEIDPDRVQEYYVTIDSNNTQELLGIGRCINELEDGQANGAGGFLGTVDDEASIYFQMFTGKPNPILSKESTVALLTPQANTFNIVPYSYYAQGIVVITHDPSGKTLPDYVMYEGATLCSHTVNVISNRVQPSILVQTFSNTNVNYATKAQFDAAKHSNYGNINTLTSTWRSREISFKLAFQLMQNFTAPPPLGAKGNVTELV
jgi:CubicO group peptidase (beta-lactamase class C family)